MSANRKRQRGGRANRGGAAVCHPLERRVLLSVINWTNKGTSTSDTDGFNAAFGLIQAERARDIVQRSIEDWQRVIVNFNRSGGNNSYNLVVRAQDLAGSLAVTDNVTYDGQGKPQSARVTVDRSVPWYFDPVIGTSLVPDDGEFTFLESPFRASNIAVNRDFYTVVSHEVGHAMGLSSSSTRLTNLATDIGDDPNDSGSGRLFTIDVNGVPGADFTYTNAGGYHLYEGPSVSGCPIHPMDLMNPARAHPLGRRNLITDTIALLLRDVYAYTIQLPSLHNTFYVNLDTTMHRVTVSGDINQNGNKDDSIDVRLSTPFLQISVNGTRENVPTIEIDQIQISANNGNDAIVIDSLSAATPATVFGGAGNDTLDIAPQSGDLFRILSPVTFNGSTDTDTVRVRDSLANRSDTFTITPASVTRIGFVLNTTAIERLELTAQTGMNTMNLEADPAVSYHIDGGPGLGDLLVYTDTTETTGHHYTIGGGSLRRDNDAIIAFPASTEIVRIDAGSGDDSFTFLPGDVFGLIGMNGNAGNDSLLIDDRADTGNDDWTIFGISLFQKSIDGLPQGGNLPTTQAQDLESVTLQASDGNNDIVVLNDNSPLHIFANGGNDRVDVRDGTAFVHTGPETLSAVFPFGDVIQVNSDAATGEDNPATVIVDQDDEVRDLEVLNANTLGTLRITTGAVLTRSAGPGSGFNVLGVIDLAGGALLMRAPAGTPQGWRAGILNGRNGGAWNGIASNGAINSSLAAGTPIGDGVGYGLGSQIAPTTTTIGSFTIGPYDTLIRYTLDGDADLNGRVNLSDFNRLAANFGAAAPEWVRGDFNYDSVVNLADFNALAANFGQALAPQQTMLSSRSPEDPSDRDDRLVELS